jgi:hypothetical protein
VLVQTEFLLALAGDGLVLVDPRGIVHLPGAEIDPHRAEVRVIEAHRFRRQEDDTIKRPGAGANRDMADLPALVVKEQIVDSPCNPVWADDPASVQHVSIDEHGAILFCPGVAAAARGE